ncbi:MAG: hypothetical protein RIR10_1494, partial [Planctomycetota bacterium]
HRSHKSRNTAPHSAALSIGFPSVWIPPFLTRENSQYASAITPKSDVASREGRCLGVRILGRVL